MAISIIVLFSVGNCKSAGVSSGVPFGAFLPSHGYVAMGFELERLGFNISEAPISSGAFI